MWTKDRQRQIMSTILVARSENSQTLKGIIVNCQLYKNDFRAEWFMCCQKGERSRANSVIYPHQSSIFSHSLNPWYQSFSLNRYLWFSRNFAWFFVWFRGFFKSNFLGFFLRIHQPWFTIRSPTLRSRPRLPIRRKLARKSGYIYRIVFSFPIFWNLSFDW